VNCSYSEMYSNLLGPSAPPRARRRLLRGPSYESVLLAGGKFSCETDKGLLEGTHRKDFSCEEDNTRARWKEVVGTNNKSYECDSHSGTPPF
jgi:hypothetical protein